VLAFILDNLLPQCQTAGDKDCSALSRVLIASLAACNHSPDAQTVLVAELKSGLQRALSMLESSEKHTRIQAMTGIISTVIEACPVPGQSQNQVFRGQQQAGTMNNIVKIILKKGLVIDLARITHNLDLSSPNMANTVNAALKPLETLSRIVNQPQTINAKPGSKKPGANLAISGTRVVSAGPGPTVANHTEGIVSENAANQQQG
jgi:E3 ubiquitin-protein ligase HUWE1